MAETAVDTRSLEAFHQTLHHLVEPAELGRIRGEVEERSRRLRALLTPSSIAGMTEQGLVQLLRSVNATRRHARALVDRTGAEGLRQALAQAVSPGGEPGQRLEEFVATVGHPRALGRPAAIELGSECLRHAGPEAAWSWPRWLWDADTGRGALGLLLSDGHCLDGLQVAEMYGRIGAALEAIREAGSACGLWVEGGSAAEVETFLAGVYVVYLGTVVRLKTTKEFASQVLPEVPVLLRRLLGTYRMEV